MQKIESNISDPQKGNFEFNELQQGYFRLTKEGDELKLKHINMIEENQRISRLLADTEERLRDTNFTRQQLSKKVAFLEEMNNDLQQLSGHNKRVEGHIKRISEIEALLSRISSAGSEKK